MSADAMRPPSRSGPSEWMRRNLFRTWYDTVLTVVFGALALYVLARAIVFVFVDARWEIIEVNLKLLMVGRWPSEELTTIAVAVAMTGLLIGLVAGLVRGRQVRAGTAVRPSIGSRLADLAGRFSLLIGTALLLLALTDTAGPWTMAIATLVAGVVGRHVGG